MAYRGLERRLVGELNPRREPDDNLRADDTVRTVKSGNLGTLGPGTVTPMSGN
jgi:hypothetical protein